MMTPSPSHTSKYLPSVDGLRTIAVFAVFFYHLSPQLVKGGFVGVDIFFVISGYLITNILKTAIEQDHFRFSEFYIRRIKRLFPAFAVVLIATAIAAYFILNPLEIVKFSRSSLAAILSVSNIYFFLNSGYFAPAADSQVLLHTWSLAVEEQFYLIWPLLTYLIVTKVPVRLQLRLILFLTLLSMVACIWVSYINANLTFYLTPFRAAEFSIGGLLCWLKNRQYSTAVADSGALFGLGLILFSIVYINSQMIFPGWVVFIPCIGTALVIFFCRTSRLTQRLIGNRSMAYLGRISYPLYLVHWPLIIFAKQLSGHDLDMGTKLFILAFAIVLATLIHEFVEKPLQSAPRLWRSNKNIVTTFTLSLSMLVVFFMQMHYFKGLPGRVSPAISTVIDTVEFEKKQRFQHNNMICLARLSESCERKSKKVIAVIGDSHGPDAINALFSNYSNADFILQNVGGCPPLSQQDFDKFIKPSRNGYKQCIEQTQRLLAPDFYSNVDYIVVSVLFSNWYTPQQLDNFISAAGIPVDKPVIILGNAPRFKKSLPDLIANYRTIDDLSEILAAEIDPTTWKFEDQIESVATKNKAKFISKIDYFCDVDTKRCELFYGESNKLLSYDNHHLGYDAARLFGQSLVERYASVDDLFNINKK